MKKRLADLAVGLAADCDHPEREVEELMRAKLPDARTLPFVGFITFDGKWVEGFAGGKALSEFVLVVETAGKSPYLQATDAVRKKLAALIPRAEKAAAKGEWNTVVKAGQAAAQTTGRCPERTQVDALMNQARAWADKQFKEVIAAARSDEGLTEPRKTLMAVKQRFAGEPEAAEADQGLAALRRLVRVQKLGSGGSAPPNLLEKAAGEFKGTRWTALFVKQEKAAGVADKDEEKPDQKDDEKPDEEDESEIETGE